jgi:hypothetical protein
MTAPQEGKWTKNRRGSTQITTRPSKYQQHEEYAEPVDVCSLGLALITNNTRDFRRVRDLSIENWTSGA